MANVPSQVLAPPATSLMPFNPPLGPQPHNPKLYSVTDTVLALQEKIFSLSKNDFTVRTADGVEILKVKGKVFSIRHAVKFTDMEDHEIFTLNNKLISVFPSFYAEAPNGHNFEITGKFKVVGSRSVVKFKNASDSRELELEVEGKWLDRKGVIKLGDQVVARIDRAFLNKREVLGASTYFVHIAPNVDIALIAAVCVAMDERERPNDA